MVTVNAAPEVRDLLNVLWAISKGEVPGWHATRSSAGAWTVTTPRKNVRLTGSDTSWNALKAIEYLGRLRSAGLPIKHDPVQRETAEATRQVAALQAAQVAKADTAATKSAALTKAKPVPPKAKPSAAQTVPSMVRVESPTVLSSFPIVSPEEGEVTYEIDVTPEMARELRARPFKAVTSEGKEIFQRPLDIGGVLFFMELIRNDKFLVTHQGLAIGENGSVYDGQHRTEAIVRTGKTVRLRVTFNVHPDKIPAFDGGRGRGTATKLKMAGIKHSAAVGAAAKILRNYLDWELAVAELGATEEDELVKPWRAWYGKKPLFFQIEEILGEHPGLPGEVDWAVSNTKRGKGFVASSLGVFKYVAQRNWPEGEEKLEEFLQSVVRGIGIDSEDHIAVAMRDYAERSQSGKTKVREFNEEQLHVLIVGWNAFVKGKTYKSFASGRLSNEFPLVHQPKKPKKS